MKYLFASVSILLMVGCGTTSYITSSWKADNIEQKNYKKVVVLGLIREADRSIREKMEMHIAGDLKELGYDAVCSCDEYNPKAFEGLSEIQALKKLRDDGVEAVLTVTLLNKEKEKHYVPGRMIYSPYSVHYNSFYGYYQTMFERINSKDYYVTGTRYFWESNFYDLGSDQLLYSVQSQSFDPASTETLGHEYGQMIIKDMVKNNVIVEKKAAVAKPM